MGENVQDCNLKTTTGGYSGQRYEEGARPKDSIFEPSDHATSDVNDPFPTTTVSVKALNPSRDKYTSSNFVSVPGDLRGAMSDSPNFRHAKPRNSRTQRRSTPHLSQPSTTHAHSLSPHPPQGPFENTQHRPPATFPMPSLHYSTSPPPHGHGGHYIGQYTMSPQPTSMGAVYSPPLYGFSHTYHHPVMSDNSLIAPNFHSPYPSPHIGPVYQYQPQSREGSSALHSSFPATGPLYPPHQASPTSTLPTSPSAQNSPHSPSYIGSGAFHSMQYSPISTPHYAYSPPFSGTPPYQPQYPHPPIQFGTGPSYSGHYAYPQIRAELPYRADAFSSVSSSTPYPPLSQHSENLSSSILHNPVVHAASQSSGSEHLPSDKHIVRQSYHPNPPPFRSEWVMWAGNIPSDATHDEIYRFFSQAPGDRGFIEQPKVSMGVVSVFLISRSNCAFVNFESEGYLLDAISRFNGIPLRADDPRCARLVCRVRRKDDDLMAGVGGQRGTGMHTRWVKDQKQKAREGKMMTTTNHDESDLSVSDYRRSTSPSGRSEHLGYGFSNISLSSDNSEVEQNVHTKHSSTSDSHSSSNSSFLARHFPKRYFILKSLTQHDLDISVQTGFWATQKHNEGILDQSYRTSKDVYLIFGANKSGEFYGYARMAGPVRRGGQSIHWATSPPPRSNLQSPTISTTSSRLSSSQSSSIPNYFSPGDHRLVDNSPLPDDNLQVKTPTDSQQQHLRQQEAQYNQSAPGMLERQYNFLSMKTPEKKLSLDQQQRRFKASKNLPSPTQKDSFELDPLAPVRAMRPLTGGGGGKPAGSTPLHSLEIVEERAEEPEDVVVHPEPTATTTSHQQQHQQREEGKNEDSWGDCFAVEWISTRKLPFNRTRHIRNPWNHDREVKVSRDGTELEPTVGQKLLDEWDKLSEVEEEQQPLTFESGGGGGVGEGEGGRYGGGSKLDGSSSQRIVGEEGGHGGGSKLDGSSSKLIMMRPRSAGEG